jgi:alpha-L-rhamnosidase
MNSFAHYSFGAVCEWMINDLAGIQSDGPGFDKIIIHPHPPTPGSNQDHEPIHWVKAHYDSIHGRIVSNWRRTGNKFELEVEIPANTTATVYIPTSSTNSVTEGEQPLALARGIKFLGFENGCSVLNVESGNYKFSSDLGN